MAKKIISQFLMPMTLCFLCGLAGLFFLWLTRRQRAGKVLITAGLLALMVLSFGAVPDYMLRSLERQYPQYNKRITNEILKSENRLPLQYVVVLGGGHIQDPDVPIFSQISTSTLARLAEGISLWRQNPGSRLVLSGGAVFDSMSEAKMMERAATELGVPPDQVILEGQSRDTIEEVRLLKSIVKDDPFLLVTSAYHMPRAMAMFKKEGIRPIPAPADYQVKQPPARSPASFFPHADNIDNAQTAIHEYLGMMWARLRGQI
ncbi:MAG: envelope biogenesis factor ElyC [Deltaproteobacteria bacterium]|nr:envelope biogenesis factor ElyC [Deltaproteobacteria bacterium]MBN2686602.1 envelope biogenesis factor ElyC [Deltaproteobacteria bacterium]